MVPVKRSPAGIPKELARLRFCERELNRRIEMQSSDAWYWEIKQKIARYCIRLKERQMDLPANQPAGELSDDEIAETHRTHSLLTRPAEGGAPGHRISEKAWMNDLRRKVLVYVNALRERQA